MKNIVTNKWYDYEYIVGSQVLSHSHIEFALKNSWLEIVERLEEGHFVRLLFKIKSVEGQHRTLSYLQTVNKEDLERLVTLFLPVT